MRILLILALAFASGCTTLPQTPSNPVSEFSQWEAHKTQLTALNDWQMESRVFIQTKKDGFSSSINWTQEAQNYQLKFTAPLNQGQYHLTGAPQNVSIRLPNNTIRNATDPETLMKDTLGFKFPVSGLSFWLRGLPYPSDPDRDIVLDSNERLSTLKQAGWEISISKYIHKDGYFLPTKLVMQNRHLKIKIAVKKWNTSIKLKDQ